MTDPSRETQDLSKLVEQSVSTLQEVDKRLQVVRSDLATLITKASQMQALPGVPWFTPSASGLPPWASTAGILGQGPSAFSPGFGIPQPGIPHPGIPHPSTPFGSGAMPFPPQVYGAGVGSPGIFGSPGSGSSFQGSSEQQQPATQAPQQLPLVSRVPSVDLADAGESFVVRVEMPGVKKDDLDILVSDHAVMVTGQTKPDTAEDGAVLLRERAPVLYRRVLQLPVEVQTTSSKATFKDGVLTLTIPKKTPGQGPRRVDVAYG